MTTEEIPAGPSKASKPPLVEAFGITGLHGYRTISLNTSHLATILIAKNGSGKTTLLGVLNAFLKGQFFRLRGLEFDTIFCKFYDEPTELILRQLDLEAAFSAPEMGQIAAAAAKCGVTPEALIVFLTQEWPLLQINPDDRFDNATYSALSREYGFNSRAIEKVVTELTRSMYEKNKNLGNIYNTCKIKLSKYEILYLPTYRRVELPLRDRNKDAKLRSTGSRRSFPAFAGGGLFTGDIQFGLSDISERLREINELIVYESNSQYRKISADIINGLIDGSYESHDTSQTAIPDKEELQLLFSRVEQSRRYGPQYPHYPVTVPDLEKIYSKDRQLDPSEKFLNYFLVQLNKVISSTKEVETRVQAFVEICNNYLSTDDISTRPPRPSDDLITDGKRLVLNRNTLQVKVVRTLKDSPISLDALSSGEKQMISLFAKLFLYESPKIVLIDEPELSLSIDWQRQILVDVVNSPLCDQLIAITHSPFVFENELDPYAGSLRVLASGSGSALPHSEDFSYGDDVFDE